MLWDVGAWSYAGPRGEAGLVARGCPTPPTCCWGSAVLSLPEELQAVVPRASPHQHQHVASPTHG